MITAYEKDGAKKWVTADITIDDTPISDVAVRLKGNSTLMGLRPDDARPGGGPPDGEMASRPWLLLMTPHHYRC